MQKPGRPPITPEELKLLATPDNDLRAQACVDCFDQATFLQRINQGERWQQLLQTHLYYDHVVSKMLTDALVDPEAVNLSRMGFAQKLSFVKALGLLDADVVTAMAKVNDLRNKIAHDLTFDLTDQIVSDLRNATPKPIRDAASGASGRDTTKKVPFNELLVAILMMAEVQRQAHNLQRLRDQKARIRLRTVLEKTPGAVYKP